MKRFLLFLSLLPSVGFCYTQQEIRERVTGCYRYYYNADYSVSHKYFYGQLPAVENQLKLNDIAVEVYSSQLSFPNFGDISYTSTNLYSSETAVRCIEVNQTRYAPLNYFPTIYPIYNFALSLYSAGYRGTGFKLYQDLSPYSARFNFNYALAVADCASSTNTIFRQVLFQHLATIQNTLSSIQTSVQNVNVDLGQFQSDYSFVNASHFDVSNVIDSAVSDSVIPSRLATSLKSMARDPSNYDYIHSVLDSYRRAQWLPLAFSDSDLASPLHNDSRVKQGLKNLGDSFGAGASYHYTTPLTNELQKLNTNWVSEAKAALSNNTQQITNQLAHMFDDTPNGIGRVIRDTANNTLSAANAAGSIDERLQRGITVAVVNEGNTSVGVHLDGPVNIDSTQWQTLSTPLGSVSSLLDSLYGDFSTFYGFGNSNYDWSHFFDLVQSFKSQNHSDLTALASHSVTGDVGRIYDYLSGYQSNILYEIATSITNSWDDYYFTRFRRANEFIDESETPFSISVVSDEVFGSGFDEAEFSNLNWFSRVELLLYQLQKANDTTNVLESTDLEGEFDDSIARFGLAATNFVAASTRVVNLFGFVGRFADSVKLAFQSSASPVTDGIVLMQGGSWLVDEPLVLRVPITVQNALRLVFQCIWYLSAFVIGWRIVVVTWDKVVTLVRWLWSVFDV